MTDFIFQVAVDIDSDGNALFQTYPQIVARIPAQYMDSEPRDAVVELDALPIPEPLHGELMRQLVDLKNQHPRAGAPIIGQIRLLDQ